MEESQAEQAAQFVSEGQLAHQAALRILESEEKEAPAEDAKPEVEEAPKQEESQQEDKQEQSAEDKKEEIKAEIRRLKLKYNGEEREVEEPEAIELAQKGYDYTQKTMALAKERDEWRAKSKQEHEAKLKEYDDKLALTERAITEITLPELKNVDWNKLASENPQEWALKLQHAHQVTAKLAEIQAERQKIGQQRQVEVQEQLQKQVKEAQDILQKDIPGWNNDLYGKILKTGVEAGFKEDEVNAITDPRAIKVLWKAMQFDALQKAKPLVDKKVEKAPKVAKPGAGEKPDQNAEQWKKGMAQLQKSGGRDMQVATELAKRFI